MLDRAEQTGNARRGREFGRVALTVGNAERMARETLLPRERERDGGIHAAGNEHDGTRRAFVDGHRSRILHGSIFPYHAKGQEHRASRRSCGTPGCNTSRIPA